MAYLLDTNIVIRLRDGEAEIEDRVAALSTSAVLSIVTRIELEGGAHRDPADALARRLRLDEILERMPVLAFGDADADAYRAIVEAAGYSRRKLLDRMIAAQALVHRATLVTQNPAGFQDIPGLDLLAW
ncbi:MAG TPA: PIN domain-containing protein [Phenylobacterium sp.]|uniref:PIN domain-containing protein n=1 Tax=Phenylobacterium sp. TaxID=1871053 RepID=UPI002BC0F6DC|nr:PIN domain-containing protein [Phenylobacterium sp.]HXA37934.1 PIN domain-containing protein [Phenylobacterium sp.]